VGNKNDYLTLEDSARMLGRPVSMLKSVMSEGKIGARLAGGRWWISVRDIWYCPKTNGYPYTRS
jgi:hypothetical protein